MALPACQTPCQNPQPLTVCSGQSGENLRLLSTGELAAAGGVSADTTFQALGRYTGWPGADRGAARAASPLPESPPVGRIRWSSVELAG
jgi:hypothetical protein